MGFDLAENALKLLDWLKSPVRWVAVLIFCTLLILLPPNKLQILGLLEFSTKYRMWIAVIALASAAILLSELFAACWKASSLRIRHWRSDRASHDYLRNLTPEERGILLYYMANKTETAYFDTGDGIVCGLEAKGLIYRSSPVGNMIGGQGIFAYNVQPWVRHYLMKNPTLLTGAVKPKTRAQRLGFGAY